MESVNNLSSATTAIIGKYNALAAATTGENIELEVRIPLTPEIFAELYDAMTAAPEFTDPTLECSIDIISSQLNERPSSRSQKRWVRHLICRGADVVGQEYRIKERVVQPVRVTTGLMPYSIGLASETPTKQFASDAAAHVRVKVRVSFMFGKWRCDFTIVRSGALADMSAALKTIKNEMFIGASLSTFTNISAAAGKSVSHELELEYMQKMMAPEDLRIIDKIFSMIDPRHQANLQYRDELYYIAQRILDDPAGATVYKHGDGTLKGLGNRVVSISKNSYYSDIYPADGYLVTDKADGERAMISMHDGKLNVVYSTKIDSWPAADGAINEIIADAEVITTPAGRRVRVFDVMHCDRSVIAEGLANRIKYIESVVDRLNEVLPADTRAIVARYVRIADNLEAAYREVYEAEYDYDLDGLIISEPNKSYIKTRNYKWKPMSHNTIDFKAMKCPQKLLGIVPYVVKPDHELYVLFSAIRADMRRHLGLGLIAHYKTIFPNPPADYYPIQFSPAVKPLAYLYWHPNSAPALLDGEIVEMGYSVDSDEWVLHRIREDRRGDPRGFGNDFRVAELTFMNYVDPFEFSDLWTPSSSYFTKTADTIYVAGNRYRRFVISTLLRDNLSAVRWVIDEASGRGADMHRYQEIGVENALFIEVDPTAVSELISRKFTVDKRVRGRNRVGGGLIVTQGYNAVHDVEYDKLIVKDVKGLTIHTMVADLTVPWRDLVAATYQYGATPGVVDGAVCNFAVHYMCDTITNMRNLLSFNARMLKVGGVFIFTVLDGEKVFALLKDIDEGDAWTAREPDSVKYAIRKRYTGAKIAPVGQMIEVKMPFTTEWPEEPLCNIAAINAEAHKLGFEMELNDPMDTHMDVFAKAFPQMHAKLTPADVHWIGMYKYVSLRKIRDVAAITGGRARVGK